MKAFETYLGLEVLSKTGTKGVVVKEDAEFVAVRWADGKGDGTFHREAFADGGLRLRPGSYVGRRVALREWSRVVREGVVTKDDHTGRAVLWFDGEESWFPHPSFENALARRSLILR